MTRTDERLQNVRGGLWCSEFRSSDLLVSVRSHHEPQQCYLGVTCGSRFQHSLRDSGTLFRAVLQLGLLAISRLILCSCLLLVLRAVSRLILATLLCLHGLLRACMCPSMCSHMCARMRTDMCASMRAYMCARLLVRVRSRGNACTSNRTDIR